MKNIELRVFMFLLYRKNMIKEKEVCLLCLINFLSGSKFDDVLNVLCFNKGVWV